MTSVAWVAVTLAVAALSFVAGRRFVLWEIDAFEEPCAWWEWLVRPFEALADALEVRGRTFGVIASVPGASIARTCQRFVAYMRKRDEARAVTP